MLDMKRIRAAAAEARYTSNPTDEELLAARSQASEARKSFVDRLRDLIKARRGKAPLPGQMSLFGAPAAKKPTAPVQGHVAKPPKGFQPIPHSKKGGYVKVEGTKRTYWYPGQGVVGKPHEADSEATPHQEATARHVIDQMAHLEAKGKISKEELDHTRQAIENAWPGGPKTAPPKVLEHYQKLQQMAAEGPEEKPEEAVPEVKIKRPGKAPATVKEIKQERAAAQAKKKAEKEKAAKMSDEDKKAAKKEAAKKAAKKRAAKKREAAAEEKAKKEKAEAAAKKKVEQEKKKDAEKKKPKLTPAQEKANKEIERALENRELSMVMSRNPDALKEITGRVLSRLMGAYDSPEAIPESHRQDAQLLIDLDDALGDDEQGVIDKLQERAEAWHQRTNKQEQEGSVEATWKERIQKVLGGEVGAGAKDKKTPEVDHEAKASHHGEQAGRHVAAALDAKNNEQKRQHVEAARAHQAAYEAHKKARPGGRGSKEAVATGDAADALGTLDDEGTPQVSVKRVGKAPASFGATKRVEPSPEDKEKAKKKVDLEKKRDAAKKELAALMKKDSQISAMIRLHDKIWRDSLGSGKKEDKDAAKIHRLYGDAWSALFEAHKKPTLKNIRAASRAVELAEMQRDPQRTLAEQEKKQHADPQYFRYPLDTKENTQASLAEFKRNKANYSKQEQDEIGSKIQDAMKRHGVEAPADSRVIGKDAKGNPIEAQHTPEHHEKMETHHAKMAKKRGSSKTERAQHRRAAKLHDEAARAHGGLALDRERGVKTSASNHERAHYASRDANYASGIAHWMRPADAADAAHAASKEHGITKALKEDETMRPEKDEDRLSKPIAKSIRVNRCTVHLDHDEALSSALEAGDLGIGTVPRTHASRAMLRKSAVGGEGFTERGQDLREAAARAQMDQVILRDDPAGNCGNGGLASWFADAEKTQEPAVRTPAAITKAMDQDQINVIDDSDPYTGRMHRADPRTKSAAFDIDYAQHRDATRTR